MASSVFFSFISSSSFGLNSLLEESQGITPELFQVGAKFNQDFNLKAVNSPSAFAFYLDQMGVFQDAKVLRHRWAANGPALGQRSHRPRHLPQPL
jgi:hypothetical protein